MSLQRSEAGGKRVPPDTLSYALRYLRAGVSIIPIKRDGSKAPDGGLLPGGSWNPFRDELVDEATARRWWGGPDPPGVAAVAGDLSGGLELIDFDRGELLDPWQDAVEEECPGLIGRLCLVRTPRQPAGYHAWFRCTDHPVPGNQKLAVDPSKRGKDRTLIETRGEGGYALVPGCPGECHETGGVYEHFAGPALWDLPEVSLEERDVLILSARALTLEAEEPARPPPLLGQAGQGVRPGDDFDRRGPDWPELLQPHGWSLAGRRGGECRWRRPGKSHGWSATTGFCRSDGCDLLRVFSSNAYPFEDGLAYGKFRAFALLEYGGDCRAAAKELAGLGFGDRAGKRRAREAVRGPAVAEVLAVCRTHPEQVLSALLSAPGARDLLLAAVGRGVACG